MIFIKKGMLLFLDFKRKQNQMQNFFFKISVKIRLVNMLSFYIYIPSFALKQVDQICSRDGRFYAYKYDRLPPQYFGVPETVELYQ